MNTLLNAISPYEHILWLMTLLSVVSLVASLFLIPLAIKGLPNDYFSNPGVWQSTHRDISPLWRIAKNLLGYSFIVFGIVMLVTPGQGLLTLSVGVLLAELPGKQRLERHLARRPGVFSALNWLRRRQGAAPFEAVTE